MTHDYKRHGTTTLFAALSVLDGTVLGRCMQRHRHQEFIRFLNANERAVPAGKLVHAIVDNYATHTHAKVEAWRTRHPRWVFHLTPKSASWINAVEGFFAALTRRRLKRGAFRSVADLQAAIKRCINRRTTRHSGHAASQRMRKWFEEAFGWIKTVAGLRQTRFRGLERVDLAFTFAVAAYNLVRLPKLMVAAPRWRR